MRRRQRPTPLLDSAKATQHRILATVSIALLGAFPLVPAEIVVEGECTLVDAMTAANTDAPTGSCPAGDPGEDTLVLTTDVVLTEVNNEENGLPTVTSEIRIEGGGHSVRRDSLAPPFRIFDVDDPGSLVLNQVEVSNGGSVSDAGIRSRGSLILTNSTVSENGGSFSDEGIGLEGGTSTITRSRIVRNSGRGITASYADLTVEHSIVAENGSDGIGDGIGVFGTGRLILENSTVSGNHSAGVDVNGEDATAEILNTTLSGNSTGVAAFVEAVVYLTHVTVSSNSYVGVDTVCEGFCTDHGSAVIKNTILARNGEDNCQALPNRWTDLGGNFSGDGSCPEGFGDLMGLDPQLANNGGATPTHAISPESTARDAAVNCDLTSDQRGRLRNDGACDSGAFEFGAPLPLNVTGSCPGEATLELAGAVPGGLVGFARGPGEGATIVPGGPCPGIEFGLEDGMLLATFIANSTGDGSTVLTLPESACGLYLQALDVETCGLSTVVQLP